MESKSGLNFILLMGKLKSLQRTGWTRFKGISRVESVADHSFRTSIMSFLCKSNPSINFDRILQMALVHDIAESLVGDITPLDNVTPEEKNKLEQTAFDEIVSNLDSSTGEYMKELWNEYEEGSTTEASLVKELDKLDMIIQALEYESQSDVNLSEFYEAKKYIKTPELVAVLNDVLIKRSELSQFTKVESTIK